jgi:hypothetical protein
MFDFLFYLTRKRLPKKKRFLKIRDIRRGIPDHFLAGKKFLFDGISCHANQARKDTFCPAAGAAVINRFLFLVASAVID